MFSSCGGGGGGVGPTVSDLCGVTALHAGDSRQQAGLAASSLTHKTLKHAAISQTGPLSSLVDDINHVQTVGEQRG